MPLRCTSVLLINTLVIVCFFTVQKADFAGAEMHISPRLLLEQGYSDNFFRSETNEREFWVTRVGPGFTLEALTDRSRLELDYTFSYFWYNTQEEDIDASRLNYAGHDFNLYAAHRFLTRLTLGMYDNFILTREPGSLDDFSQGVDPSKYWRNRVSPFINYDIAEKGEVNLRYRNEEFRYLDKTRPGQDDSSEHRGILTLTYHLNETNHLDLQGQVWRREYDGTNSDYDAYWGSLIFRHEFNTYLKGLVQTGYQNRNFDKGSLDDVEEFTFQARLEGATELSKLWVRLRRGIPDFVEGDAYFRAYQGDAYVERIFLEKIRGYLGGYYQFSDYFDSPREDNTYVGFGGLGYRFLDNIFELSLEYSYEDRDSNQPGGSYTENRVYLRLNMLYDFASK